MLTKKLISLLVLVLVVLVAVVAWLGFQLRSKDTAAEGAKPSEYSVVVMANGEVLFGKLSWFMNPKLVNAWSLQTSRDDRGQTQAAVVPLAKAAWGPVDEVNLSREQIVSWASLRKDSPLVKTFDNPQAAAQAAQAQNQMPPSALAPATSTKK